MTVERGGLASAGEHGAKQDRCGHVHAVDQLVREHDNLAQLLVVVDSLFASIASGEEADDDLIRDATTYLTEFVDAFHHGKEDLALAVAAERAEGLQAVQRALRQQHLRIHEAGTALCTELERMLLDEPVRRQDLAAEGFAYTAEIRRNIEFEESKVFPVLLDELGADAWARIESELACPPDPLFGPAVNERYRTLFRTLTRKIGMEGDWPREGDWP
jgi:hemerythrin-like domain-containing protein